MADSPFLKHQDKNNDGLPDVCKDFTSDILLVNKCPPCTRNPNAIVPNWKKRGTQEPWFNEKYCLMQCTVVTEQTALPENADELFQQYESVALDSLLDNFNKISSAETIDMLRPHLQYSKYDLSPREGLPVKLLYSVPVEQFALIEDDVVPEADEDKEPAGPITVTYDTKDVFPKLMKLRKVMYLYSRYYRVFTGVEGGNLFFEDSGVVFAHNKFDRYGDPGFFVGSSRMADVLKDLDNFLNDRNYNLFLGNPGKDFKYLFSYNNVTKFTMEFSSEYELTKLKIYTVGCREKPKVFGKKRLTSLNSKAAYKDPTALAYFSRLDEIDTFLSARVARPWLEFVQEFTYPKVVTQPKFPAAENDNDNIQTALSCVTDNLANEAKQLGQDIVDDIFSIGDAVAYAFHKNVCKRSMGDINTELEQMGIVYKTNKKGKQRVAFNKLKDPKTGETKSIAAMATSQAFEQLESDDQVFVQMCASMLATSLPLGTSTDEIIRSLYRDGLGRLKLCGLLDLMMDAIKCLFKGLTLEEALKVALKSALKALPLNNWGALFVGLPPDKQAELDELVRKKLSEPPARSDQRLDDVERGDDNIPLFGKITFSKPWEDEELLERELATKSYGNYDNEVRQVSLSNPYAQKNQRTLAQKYDEARQTLSEGNNNFGINPDSIMNAYIIALIEVYSNDLLSLVDQLNQFPGAEIIAKIISIFDCPAPPTFDPNFADFLNSIDLPFCRNINEIQLPMLQNPFGWIPEWSDILEKLYEALVVAIQQVLLRILFRILVKVCQLIGDAICKALETVGSLVASLPDLVSGRDTISNIIRESICGPNASQEQVDATIADMFAKFGVGGAALSNSERIKQFCEALSSATTRKECIGATVGDASPEFLEAGHTILLNQFPEFADALPTQQDLADLFTNVGNLMPAGVRSNFRDFLDNLPAEDDLPANPSLCATTEDLDAFKDRRCMLLEGRATREQCETMFDGLQNDLLEDLEELTGLTQGGVANAISDALPPLISTPGCDDGILPYENELDNAVTTGLVDGVLQQLQVAYSKDMLGNGGLFAGQDDWGLMNMVLADTKGRALSTHRRRSASRKRYVDYASEVVKEEPTFLEAAEEAAFGVTNIDGVGISRQEGQFPTYVAEHLWQQMYKLSNNESVLGNKAEFNSDNTESNVRTGKRMYRSFEDLGYEGFFGTLNVNLLTMPDFGYNTRFTVDMDNERVVIKKGARKNKADVTLSFQDNNDGLDKKDRNQKFGFGFDLKMWFSDVHSYKENSNSEKIFVNRFDDNARVSIVYKTFDRQPGDETEKENDINPDNDFIRERKYEFLSVDNTLDSIEVVNYPHYLSTQNTLKEFIPQIYMLADLTGLEPNGNIKSFHDSFLTTVMQKMLSDVCGAAEDIDGTAYPTKTSWLYGAAVDDLAEEDMEYVIKRGQSEIDPGGTPYGKAKVTDYDSDGDPDGNRKISNDDMILGISYMQFKGEKENRVFFLDPTTYGGSYTRPKIFIKPMDNTGWLGMIDVMFPDAGPCKPQYTDLVDFKQITDSTAESYNTMPEDQRLKGDPDCITENPYNRILMRESKATIQSLITAACRIYASVHFVKAMATFTTFNTTIRENYSSIFSAYIVEIMEKDFKDAQGDFLEAFNGFKDEEFWYAFLEQSVQTYARLADEGRVIPPEPVLQAMYRLNDKQEKYRYPNKTRLKAAKATRRAQKLQTLKSWRYEKNLDAIQATEEDAKLVLKEFVAKELTVIAETFNKNAKQYNLKPEYNDLTLYILKNFAVGAESLDMDKEIVEKVVDLGEVDDDENLYTSGGELSLPDGTEYVGYFHKHENEDGVEIYMVGEAHSDETHEELTLFAHKVEIEIGDIDGYGSAPSTTTDKPLKLEKYISINGNRYSPSEAVNIIKNNDPTKNISDVYPGTLELVKDEQDRVIGTTGQLGVRYGLQFSININGKNKTVTTVEIDALDLKCSQMPTIDANSKLLYCLINMLRDDEKFKILMNYVIPVNKFTSLIAIYNDLGFLPSIGQITVDKGMNQTDDISDKPGLTATITEEGVVESIEGKPGWEHYKDRNRGWSIGYRTWDEWDKELLRNSRSVIKRLFKPLYNSRDFESSVKSLSKLDNGGNIYAQNLKSILSLPPGAGFLSWWDWGRLMKTSPFNGRGKLCTKNDE